MSDETMPEATVATGPTDTVSAPTPSTPTAARTESARRH